MATPPRRTAALVGGAGLLGAILGACAPTASGDAAYRDGTYSASGSYAAPSGTETIEVELTLESDVVVGVTVTPQVESGEAARFQEQFASGIAAAVLGVDIDELQVSRVAGSSLTSDGFNQAVTEIKAQAVES